MNRKEPKISVIMPVYNAEKTIERAILSIINQTYNNIELILINDGSIDGTESIIKKYIEKGKKIEIKYYFQKNSGPSIAKNLGIDMAKGEYILFVDSDDTISENYIESLVINQKEDTLIGASYKIIRDTEKNDNGIIITNKIYDIRNEILNDLVIGNLNGFVVLYLFNKEQMKDIYFEKDIRYMEDTLFLIKYIINNNINNIIYLKDVYYNYYQTDGSITNNTNKIIKNILSFTNSIRKIENIIPKEKKELKEICKKNRANRISKLIENNVSKIRERKILKEYQKSEDIKQIIKELIEDCNINKVYKLYLKFTMNSPYILFLAYVKIREILKKMK